jgi:hypothetical protein
MAIKGGQILHVATGVDATGEAGFIVDRIQTGGLTGINVNEERLEELGNYQAIGTIRDIPDLTFEIESFDVTTEMESVITGGDNTEAGGTLFDLTSFVPLDILSPYKTKDLFTVDNGSVIVPTLFLESVSYSMSLTEPMSTTWGLRGDSVFYVPGSPYRELFSGDAIVTAFNFANTALQSVIAGDTYFGLAVYVDGVKQRLGTDYTNTATGVTFTTAPPTGTDNVVLIYGSSTAATYAQGVHNTTDPAGVRGRDINVQWGDGLGAYTDWFGVQSANFDWRVTLERDEEFNNPLIVGQDFDTPETTGTVTMKPQDVSALFGQLQDLMSLTATDIVNATEDPPELEVRAVISDSAGVVTKTLQVGDAKWTMPALQGTVGSKLEADFEFTSASGVLNVYKGAMP